MKSSEYQTLYKMMKYIEKVEKYTFNVDYNSFSKNEEKVNATILALGQIGELVRNLNKDFIDKYSNIKWRQIKGMRNRLIHDYDGINVQIVWDTITYDIPVLKKQLNKILNEDKIEWYIFTTVYLKVSITANKNMTHQYI